MGKYEEALQGLNSAQRKAVETIDGPVLVIAGPGTGKTQLLTTRVAHILATTDALPQNVLCLTFTDSAAQTMRERLAGMVGQAAYGVTISTYHSFGSDIIRRFLEYTTDQTDKRPIDDLGIDRIYRAILARLPYSNPLKYADVYLGDVKTLISDAKRALLMPDDLRAIAKDNLAFIVRANPIVRTNLEGMVRLDKKELPRFTKLAGAVKPANKALGTNISSLEQLFIISLDEALAAAEAANQTTPVTAWKNEWLAKDSDGQFVVDGDKTNQKLLAAADIYEHYLHELKTNGLFDYDDMILRAIHLLETNDETRFTLQEQYQYVLLDEFQDTNEAQLRLVELLTNNPVNEGRPNVMAVGDDDQAIYAFQGANYSHMLRFTEMYKDVVTVPLTENYRSHANVLHLTRGIAEQIEERLHHHFPAIEKLLTASGKNLPKQAVVQRREAKSDIMQFAWVAKQINALIKQGIRPNEIAVLAPQHKYLEPLVPFLREAKVPMRYEKRENVLDDPAINELLSMSRLVLALAHQDRASANALWPEVLSFDFWQLPTSLIWQLGWEADKNQGDWTTTLCNNQRLQEIALFFIQLGQRAASELLENMLDYLIGSKPADLHEPNHDGFTSPYYRYYFDSLDRGATQDSSADFWNLLNNLIVLRARLREYHKEDGAPLTLPDFIEFVEAHRATNLKIINTSPYASTDDAVQLMTAFKAKGMEFTVVFVLATQDEAWGSKARGQGARISLPPNLRFIRYAGMNDDERLRLLYVAMTRAKSQLYLTSYTQNYGGKTMSRLRYLNETVEPDGTVVSPLLPADSQRVLPAEDGIPQPTTELAAFWHQRHLDSLEDTKLQTLLRERLAQYQLSPTHLGDFIDLVHAGPQVFFMQAILRFPRAPSIQLHYGNAVHETLEWLHSATKQAGDVPSLKATTKTFSDILTRKPLATQDRELFLERGKTALAAYLAQRHATISPHNIVEHPFHREGVFLGKAHLSGKIDKLIIDKQSKEITIVDYKTSKSHVRWSRDVSLHKYRQQLYLYKALVEGSNTFAGYRVTDAYLEFVEPDETGQIRELHLQFDEADYQHIKKLAAAVWQHITSLTLPNISGYSADLSGIEQFEADLLNRQ